MVAAQSLTNLPVFSLDDWMQNPPERTEWVDGTLVEKHGMTLKHSKVQGNLYFQWRRHRDASSLGGEVYTEVPCRTHKQGRSPDVAYLTPDLVAQYGDAKVLPQSFPLIAEVISPTDLAEEMITKAQEYLQSGAEEVWLVYPDVKWVIVMTQATQQIFVAGQIVQTQHLLPGFQITVDELLA
ncbi:Uma2 family endonuclease [Leptolyngbya sp. 7M]|uniref:Uma2 family endonuclease n=1 Tax=Leptolyngbya sp. 7M TaxID=2812896 RepID=UPI001B8A9CED|nr:Uma2 family endonuclease [Leptolyngbya sp. 7M]QYO64957.1 Uma2 family endonuclease [Leptolyngbya sp. 7M]